MTKKIISVYICCILLMSSCGSKQDELATLRSQPPATSVAGAELAYTKAATLAAKIAKEKNPPQEILDGAFELQRQRAVEFKTIAIKQHAVGSAWKVFRALQGSGAPVIDLDWSFGKNNNSNQDPEKSLEGIDPTRDTPASELQKGGKK